jgi:hypothetical protein
MSGFARRLYVSAQVVAVAAACCLSIPFWVVRLHDRYVSRKAAECWQESQFTGNEQFRAKALALIYPNVAAEPCTSPDCAWHYSKVFGNLGLQVPGLVNAGRCRIFALPPHAEGNDWKTYEQDAMLSCARNLRGRAIECQLGHAIAVSGLSPVDLWDRSEEIDRAWAFGSTSGRPLPLLVASIYPGETAASVALLLAPLFIALIAKWGKWLVGGQTREPPART